ncbi:MAG TPA: hypothetical protein PKH94_09840 [Bacteroidales bacterium]|nr:hypothetical protein [Bacteroidales bacterium]
MFNTWIAVSFSLAVLAGCAGNPDSKTGPQDEGTVTEQVSQDLEATLDSVTVAIDSATQAIEESSQELDQLLNDLNE